MRMYTPWTDRTKSGGNCRDTNRMRFTQGSSLDCRRPGGYRHPINTSARPILERDLLLSRTGVWNPSPRDDHAEHGIRLGGAVSDTMRSLLVSTYYPPEHGGISHYMASVARALGPARVSCLTNVLEDRSSAGEADPGPGSRHDHRRDHAPGAATGRPARHRDERGILRSLAAALARSSLRDLRARERSAAGHENLVAGSPPRLGERGSRPRQQPLHRRTRGEGRSGTRAHRHHPSGMRR